MTKPFNDTLASLRYGTLVDDLTDAMHGLVVKCAETGKQGKLTLTLTLKPGKGGQIEIVDDVSIKAPKDEKGTSILFATPEGNLSREDPRQLSLEGLRSVDNETGELRRVN